MNGYAFTLCDVALVALPSGALHVPGASLLVVSDLHFGKSDRMARRGGTLLPPYETRATLARLDAELGATGARRVICLGDSFDDTLACDALEDSDRLWLLRLMAGREWTWILGNHDPAPMGIGGTHLAETHVAGLTFRHIATAGQAEVSGHYHPKVRLAGRAHRCFLVDASRLVMPAFGAYTGGLWCEDPALCDLMQPAALAILTGSRAQPIPMPRVALRPRAAGISYRAAPTGA